MEMEKKVITTEHIPVLRTFNAPVQVSSNINRWDILNISGTSLFNAIDFFFIERRCASHKHIITGDLPTNGREHRYVQSVKKATSTRSHRPVQNMRHR